MMRRAMGAVTLICCAAGACEFVRGRPQWTLDYLFVAAAFTLIAVAWRQ